MQKLKNVLHGHKKDDEATAGSGEGKHLEQATQADTSHDTSNAAGVKRQILNPGGHKADEVQYGSVSEGGSGDYADTRSRQLETDPNQKEGGILRQVLNPGGHKADDLSYGSATAGAAASDSGPTASTSTTQQSGPLPGVPDDGGRFLNSEQTSNTLASGSARGGGASVGTSNMQSEPAVSRDRGAGLGDQSSVSNTSSSQQNYGRDAALAGATAATAGNALDQKREPQPSQPADDADSTRAVKDFPATTQSPPNTTQNTSQAAANAANQTSASSVNQTDQHRTGRDAAAIGGTGMALAGADAAWKKHERPEDDYDFNDPNPYSSRPLDPRVDTISRNMPGAFPRGDSFQDESKQDREATVPATSRQPEARSDAGRDFALAGATGAAGIGTREHQGTLPQRQTAPVEPASRAVEEPKHHYGRDAAVASGLGAGAYEADKHLKDKENIPSRTPAPTQTTDPTASTVQPEQHISSTEPVQPPQTQAQGPQLSQHVHNDGRETAMLGGAGAGALGGHEAHKHHDASQTESQPAQLSQRVHNDGRELPSLTGSGTTGAGAYEPSRQHQASTAPIQDTGLSQRVHNDGRELAALTGGGAAGVGGYEAYKHHEDSKAPVQPSQPSSAAPTYRGPGQASGAKNDYAPVDTQQSTTQAQPQHHYGRDAALVGGAGVAGYEADKHLSRREEQTSSVSQSAAPQYTTPMPPPTTRQESSYSQLDAVPFINYDPPTPQPQPQPPIRHDAGRDAAVAGGAGAATWLGADELDKKHRQRDARDPDPIEAVGAHMQPRYEDQRAEMHDHSADRQRHVGAFAGTAEPLPAAKELKGKEPATEGRQQHHFGRDAAMAGAGAAGVGAYEHEKHTEPAGASRGQHATVNPSERYGAGDVGVDEHVRRTHEGAASAPGQQQQVGRDTMSTGRQQHHFARDGALAGGAGAMGAGAYEAGKHRDDHGRQQQSTADPSANYGAGAVGVDEHVARTHEGATSTSDQQQHHFGRDAALGGGVGAAAAGVYEHERRKEPTGMQAGTGRGNQPTADPSANYGAGAVGVDEHVQRTHEDGASSAQQHHLGRDAALAGGLGAAGAGAYEADKHRHGGEGQPTADPSANYGAGAVGVDQHVQRTHEGTTGPSGLQQQHHGRDTTSTGEQHHHLGRDAAVAGGLGAAGAGAYEHKKQREPTGAEYGREQQYATAGQSTNYGADQHIQRNHEGAPGGVSGQQQHHHLGRDTAVAGGVGAAGVGAYEAGKHHGLTKEEEAMQAGTGQPVDADYEYVKNYQNQHGTAGSASAGAAPERITTHHSRTSSKGEKEHKHGSVLGKIFHRKSRSNMQDDSPTATGTTAGAEHEHGREKHPTVDTAAKYGAGAVGAEELARRAHESPTSTSTPDRSYNTESLTPTRSPTEMRHSPKQSGEFVQHSPSTHLGRNKLHKDPPAKYLERHGIAGGNGSGNNTPSRMTSSATRDAGAEGGAIGEREQPRSSVYDVDDRYDGGYRGVESYDSGAYATAAPGTATAAGFGAASGTERGHGYGTAAPGTAIGSGPGAATSGPESGSGLGSTAPGQGNNFGAGTGTGVHSGVVTEPHTGLPMNVAKYGSGAGGTDGAANIEGFHGQREGLSGYQGPDLEGVRKNDTLY